MMSMAATNCAGRGRGCKWCRGAVADPAGYTEAGAPGSAPPTARLPRGRPVMANVLAKPSARKPSRRRRPDDDPEPAWDIARLFPAQGHWSEDEYLALNGNHLVEFSDGRIAVLPLP